MNYFKIRNDLSKGKTVQIELENNLCSKKLVTVYPIESEPLQKDNIVFCDVNNSFHIYRIQNVRPTYGQGYQYQVGTKNQTFGTIGIQHIYGIVKNTL